MNFYSATAHDAMQEHPVNQFSAAYSHEAQIDTVVHSTLLEAAEWQVRNPPGVQAMLSKPGPD